VVGKALHDEIRHVDPACERESPVALQHRREPAQIADEHRVVHPEFQAQVGGDFRRNVGIRDELAERIPGGQRQDGEQHDADAQQAGHSDQQPSEDVGPREAHRTTLPGRYAAVTSRNQSCNAQKSLSQPLSGTLSFKLDARTRGRETTGRSRGPAPPGRSSG
jgi:hypothetical protein